MPTVLELTHRVGFLMVLCVLQAGLGLLWVQRRIGPNSILGLRTVRTMSDRDLWYDTHRVGRAAHRPREADRHAGMPTLPCTDL